MPRVGVTVEEAAQEQGVEASTPQTIMIDKERWFSSHTPSYQ